ncbi:MAG: GIY-YIG nuclease family protein [Alphaproteobacteria bacterium]
MQFFVYILVSRSGNALYVGSTRDLRQRLQQHRAGTVGAHTRKYRIHKLVYFEIHDTLEMALAREKRIKRWHREWKEDLIESVNPTWRDLVFGIPY